MKKPIAIMIVFAVVVFYLGSALAATYQKADTGIVINGAPVQMKEPPVIFRQRLLVPAKEIFQKLGARVVWDASNGFLEIAAKDNTIGMNAGSMDAFVDGWSEKLDVAPVVQGNTVMVPVRFVAEILGYKVGWDSIHNQVTIGQKGNGTSPTGNGGRVYKVVIDAGHGGFDPGAFYGGIGEKTLNIDIAKRLERLLSQSGVKTYMTRTDDTFVNLYDRSGLANRVGADLFLSVHNNAEHGTRTSGSMSMYYPSDSRANGGLTSKEFAAIAQQEMVKALGSRDLGIVPRPYLAVLRTTNIPAIMAEVGYMTNSMEMIKLKTPDYRQKAAEALSNAVLKALKEI